MALPTTSDMKPSMLESRRTKPHKIISQKKGTLFVAWQWAFHDPNGKSMVVDVVLLVASASPPSRCLRSWSNSCDRSSWHMISLSPPHGCEKAQPGLPPPTEIHNLSFLVTAWSPSSPYLMLSIRPDENQTSMARSDLLLGPDLSRHSTTSNSNLSPAYAMRAK